VGQNASPCDRPGVSSAVGFRTLLVNSASDQNAVIFAGRMGEALVFDAAGNMFRGNLLNRAAFPFADGAKFRVVFELLEVIE
jgi:hypothetical protein